MIELKPGLHEINGELYYLEPIGPGDYSLSKVEEVVYRHRSKYQLIEIIRLYRFGLALFLDNSIQFAEVDEHLFHEPFAHIPLFSHPSPENVLIIGGGDGALLREVVKHDRVRRVVLVEIDEDVIKAVKKYIPHVPNGAFENRKVKIVIEDGYEYVRNTEEKFDVIFMDVTDEYGPSIPLYTRQFYSMVKRILNRSGIFVVQSLGLYEHPGATLDIIENLRKVFKFSWYYKVYVPSFNDEWTITYASDDINIHDVEYGVIEERFRKENVKTKFYNPRIHMALLEQTRGIPPSPLTFEEGHVAHRSSHIR